MEALANLVIAAADLVEAEGRTLRRQMVRLATAATMILVAALLALLGLGFLLYGLFWLLAEQMSSPAAAACFGIAALAAAGGIAWSARRIIS